MLLALCVERLHVQGPLLEPPPASVLGISLRGLRILAEKAEGRTVGGMWNAVWANETVSPEWNVVFEIPVESDGGPGAGNWKNIYRNRTTGEERTKHGGNVAVFEPPAGCMSVLSFRGTSPRSWASLAPQPTPSPTRRQCYSPTSSRR